MVSKFDRSSDPSMKEIPTNLTNHYIVIKYDVSQDDSPSMYLNYSPYPNSDCFDLTTIV